MRINMTSTKFEELKSAIYDYGDAAFQNLLRCKALGEAIIEGYPKYIGSPEGSVSAVPIEGPFDPRNDYGDEAYSFHKRDVIILEPIRFGLSLVVRLSLVTHHDIRRNYRRYIRYFCRISATHPCAAPIRRKTITCL